MRVLSSQCYADIIPNMSKNTSQESIQEAIDRIKFYCDQHGLSVNAFAKLANVGQPSLFKFLNHQRAGIPRAARAALTFIEKSNNWNRVRGRGIDLEGQRIIDEAINSIWDGRYESAVVVASLIQALKPAVDVVAKRHAPSP